MPDLLFNALCWFGFAHYPQPSRTNTIKTLVLQFLVVIMYADTMAIYIVPISNPMFPVSKNYVKILLQNMILISFSIALVILMTYKKQNLTNLQRNLQFMYTSDCKKKTNVVVCYIFCFPLIYALTLSSFHIARGPTFLHRVLSYGIPLQNKTVNFIISFYKLTAYSLLYPTLPNLVALAYSASCHLCCRSLKEICAEMKRCSSKAFTSSVQVEFLKKRLRIVNVLEEIQEVFSAATFIVCTANFTACLANLAQTLIYVSENIVLTLVEVFFISSSTVASMVCIFFSAGKVPDEMQRFSAMARRHYEQRMILGLDKVDKGAQRLLLDETFTMSGCGLIFYRKSTILAVLGTILTYGLLILNLD